MSVGSHMYILFIPWCEFIYSTSWWIAELKPAATRIKLSNRMAGERFKILLFSSYFILHKVKYRIEGLTS